MTPAELDAIRLAHESAQMADDCVEGPEDDACWTCRGTGIGQFGDPDTSKCGACGGSGVRRESAESRMERAERRWDEGMDR